jgi:DNA-binding MurR/RpiR family transcriptional regulator
VQFTFYLSPAQEHSFYVPAKANREAPLVDRTAKTGVAGGNGSARPAAVSARAPRDFEALAARVGERFNDLPRQLQRIARFALDAPEDFALGTAAQLAAMIGVQPSALVRFAGALGYDGFADLRQVFRGQLRSRPPSYRERIEQLRSRLPGATAPAAVLQDQVDQAVRELQHFAHSISPEALDRAVDLLTQAPHLHLLAARRSFPVASYLAYALNQLERRVQLLDGVAGMNRELALRIPAGEVLVAVSFRNYTGEVVEIADSCRARGVGVIAITDSVLSPLARTATVTFALGDDGGVTFRSLVEPIVLAQALVVAVGHRLAEGRARRRKAAR